MRGATFILAFSLLIAIMTMGESYEIDTISAVFGSLCVLAGVATLAFVISAVEKTEEGKKP